MHIIMSMKHRTGVRIKGEIMEETLEIFYEQIKRHIARLIMLRKLLKPSDKKHGKINNLLTELYDLQYNLLQYAKIR